mmetsp:Transcript_22589/g.35132  ORF Transcript_22589/g.35132 Transcript_22589/m.35132 type:complete len:82 (-) Transcript_22589:157-402(-)
MTIVFDEFYEPATLFDGNIRSQREETLKKTDGYVLVEMCFDVVYLKENFCKKRFRIEKLVSFRTIIQWFVAERHRIAAFCR